MKIVIPTKNRQDTIQTHKYFGEFDYYVLVHNKKQLLQYRAEAEKTGIDPERLHVTNVADDQFGLTRQREWACKHLVSKGDWLLFADDNVKEVQAVAESAYSASTLPVQTDPGMRAMYEQRCEPSRFMEEIIPEGIKFCESIGARHMGFSSVDNFFFRANKWKRVAYIIGKLMLWHNTGELQFDHTVTMEDFELTCQSLLKFGVAPVNNFVYPVAGHYQKGGMGKKEERLPDRKNDIKILLERYPELLLTKPGDYPDLKLRYHTMDQIANWQNKMKMKSSSASLWS